MINKAVFETEGTMEVYNPILSAGNNQEARLMPNSININSKKLEWVLEHHYQTQILL